MYKEAGPVIETPLSGAQCIHDMLLQSWGGKSGFSRQCRMPGRMLPTPVYAQKEPSKFLPAETGKDGIRAYKEPGRRALYSNDRHL